MRKIKIGLTVLFMGLIILGANSKIWASVAEPSIESISTDVVQMQQPEGGDLIAINVYANSSNETEKAEVYRSTSQGGEYTLVGTTDISLSFYDTTVSMNTSYYYYMLPISYDGRRGQPCYAEPKKVELLRPAFKIKSMKKDIVLALPASNFTENLKYLEIADKIFGSGIEIYRGTNFSGKYKKIATVSNDTKTFTDKTAKKNKFYVYAIKTYYKDPVTGKVYRSDFSEKGYAKKGDTDDPAANKVKLKAVYKNGNIKITWKNPKGYKPFSITYEYNEDPESDYYTKDKRVELKKKANSYTIKKAKKNADYYILLSFQDSEQWKYDKYCFFNRSTDYYRIHVNTGVNRNLDINDEMAGISYDPASGVLTNTTKISWTPVAGATSYTVSICDGNKNVLSSQTVTGDKNSCEISHSVALNDNPDTFYVIKFSVTNGNKTVDLYKNNRMVLDYIYPKDINVAKTAGGVQVSWADQSTKGATSYTVYRYSYGGGYNGFCTGTVETGYMVGQTTGTSIMDTSLITSGNYYYVVVPSNGDCSSHYLSTLREYGKKFSY